MAMLAMTNPVHFGVLYWATGHLHAPQGPTCGTILQPSHLGHARPVGWQLWLLYGAFYVSSPRINPHIAMTMAMAGKQGETFWSEIRHKGGCYCFGLAVYAPWACYMDIRALYTTKPAKFALSCHGDLVADH